MTPSDEITVFLSLDQWERCRRFVDAIGWDGTGERLGRQAPGYVTLPRDDWRSLANNLNTGDDRGDVALRHHIMRDAKLSLRPAPKPHDDGFLREDFERVAKYLRTCQ